MLSQLIYIYVYTTVSVLSETGVRGCIWVSEGVYGYPMVPNGV